MRAYHTCLGMVVLFVAAAAAMSPQTPARLARTTEVAAAFDLSPDEAECMAFMLAHLPPVDGNLTVGYLVENVREAVFARNLTSWGTQVPWSIFLNDVLPYASLDEPRERWRPFFSAVFLPLVTAHDFSNISQAALWMNDNIWELWHIHFVPDQTPFTMAPLQVIERANASCTGLAIFFVDALRSVGIPARVAGTPHWNFPSSVCNDPATADKCGNHDWAEVWLGQDDGWSFTGPLEYNGAWNKTWFFPGHTSLQVPGTKNHSIFATSYATVENHTGAPDYFPMLWDWASHWVPGIDRTSSYLVPPLPSA